MACKFKVGDRVRANKKSNGKYYITNERNNCEGTVVEGNFGNEFNIKITANDMTDEIGKTYLVKDTYFDLIEELELHITVKGNETIGVYKHDGKTDKAVAKCSPEDTFDFATGVKLVCERLGVLPTEEEPKPKKQALKFKTGDYAKIIAKKHGHEFKIGTIVKLKAGVDNYKAYCDDKCWWVKDDELEAYTPPVEEPKYFTGRVICIQSNHKFWTKGKIYEVKDGEIRDDEGDPRRRMTLDELTDGLGLIHKPTKFIALVE